MKRLLTIPEMITCYLALAGCVLALVKSQTRERAILVAWVSFSLFFALVYALVVTNVGSLYRVRYPAMLVLCALGTWGWIMALQRNARHGQA